MTAGRPKRCGPCRFRKPVSEITDRAARYRARACPPAGRRVCFACGSQATLIHHIDGDESNGSQENLSWCCRRCNAVISRVLRHADIGRVTCQYNPPGDGATNLGTWINAVLSLRGQPGGDMNVADAVAIVQATPPTQRSKFAKEIWRIRKSRHGASGRAVPF